MFHFLNERYKDRNFADHHKGHTRKILSEVLTTKAGADSQTDEERRTLTEPLSKEP